MPLGIVQQKYIAYRIEKIFTSINSNGRFKFQVPALMSLMYSRKVTGLKPIAVVENAPILFGLFVVTTKMYLCPTRRNTLSFNDFSSLLSSSLWIKF
jgi:hypothetical protein